MIEEENDISLRELVQENLKLTKALQRSVERTRRYILWGRVMDTLKFLFVIGALAGTYFLIEPYVRTIIDTYQGLFTRDANGQNASPLIEELGKFFNTK